MPFLAKTSTLLLTGVLTVGLMFFVFPNLPLPGVVLDSHFGYNYKLVISLLTSYGETGRNLYIAVSVTLDVLLPLVYVGLFVGLIRRLQPDRRWLIVLPILVGCLDLLENSQIIRMMVQFPEISVDVVAFASMVTQTKFVLSGLTILLILTLIPIRIVKNRRVRLF